jgi:hypothetical protein
VWIHTRFIMFCYFCCVCRLTTGDNRTYIDKIVLCVFDANDENLYRAVAQQLFPLPLPSSSSTSTSTSFTSAVASSSSSSSSSAAAAGDGAAPGAETVFDQRTTAYLQSADGDNGSDSSPLQQAANEDDDVVVVSD